MKDFLGTLLSKLSFIFVPLIAGGTIFAIVLLSLMSFYVQMTGGESITFTSSQPIDQQIKTWINDDIKVDNIKDTWVRDSVSSPYRKANAMLDYYGRDKQLALTFGQVYTQFLYFNSIMKIQPEKHYFGKISDDLHPTFWYTDYGITYWTYSATWDPKKNDWVRDEKGNVVFTMTGTYHESQYLLDKANTILGWYYFNYTEEIRTQESLNNKTHEYTKIVTDSFIPDGEQIAGNKYDRLRAYESVNFWSKKDTNTLDNEAIIEQIAAFDEHKVRLEWLLQNAFSDYAELISSASIPAEYKAIIDEIAKKYGIPSWLIAAIIDHESRWVLDTKNSLTGAWGLMQVMPDNWNYYCRKLGYNPVADKYNPKAMIDVGTYILREAILQTHGTLDDIDWNNPADWHEKTAAGLAIYGGYGNDVQTAINEFLNETRKGYNPGLWIVAEKYQSKPGWPVPSSHTISSGFKLRINPITGKLESHPGIDIAADYGADVDAAAPGKVVVAGWVNGYGNCVVIRDATHDYLYGHMSAILVKIGDIVKAGQTIGRVGSTGLSTGPHLHFGVSVGDWTNGNWIDPNIVLDNMAQ